MHDIYQDMVSAIELGRTDIVKSILDACDNNEVICGSEEKLKKEHLLNQPYQLDGSTFLALATKLNQKDVVRALLAAGANPNIPDNRGLIAFNHVSTEQMQQIYLEELLRAIANSEINRVTQMLDAGVSVNAWDSKTTKNSPLHWAACYADRTIIACLINEYGANLNRVNGCGATPLHDAVMRGEEGVIDELLRSGADVTIKATKGKYAKKSPHDLVQEFQPQLLHIFQEYSNVPLLSTDQPRGSMPLVPLPRVSTSRTMPIIHNSTVQTPIECHQPSPYLVNSNNKTHSANIMDSISNLNDINNHSNIVNNNNHNNSMVNNGSELDCDEQTVKPPSPAHNSQPPAIMRGLSASQGSSLDLSPRLNQVIENLVRTHIGSPVRPLVTHSSLHLLWPQPQKILELQGPPFIPPTQLQISVIKSNTSVHEILDVWDVHRSVLTSLGYDVRAKEVQPPCSSSESDDAHIECTVNPRIFSHQDAYQIHITSRKIKISSSNKVGFHYALSTFAQLLRMAGAGCDAKDFVALQPVLIQDHPAMKHRAVLLDISPMSRVPSMEYLFEMIETWSSLKISHIHLYTRLVSSADWQLCYDQRSMVTIDRHCQDRFVSLLPVLDVEASVTIEDVRSMWPAFQKILASFSNLEYVHLGPCLSNLLINNVIGNDIISILTPPLSLQEFWHLLAIPPDVTIMLCSNNLHSEDHKSLQVIQTLHFPTNMVLVEYGFQADYDFLQWTEKYHVMGCATCLCPGTASWNSLAGCPEASICNIYRAARAVVGVGSLGMVVAHWSGSFHLTPHPFSWPGFMVGAGLSWNPETHWDYLHNSLPALLDTHIFLDKACCIGEIILELGHAETYTVRSTRGQEIADLSDLPSHTGSTFYQLLTKPDSVDLDNLTTDIFSKVTKHIKRSQSCLLRAKLCCNMSDMVMQEIGLSIDLMLTACKIGRCLVSIGINPNSNMGCRCINLGVSNLPPTFRTDIANKLLALVEQYKGMWLQRHLAAGLQNSLLILTTTLRRFVPEDEV